jgi:hypothetical protein
MSAKLIRSGGAWVVRALVVHTFATAKEARLWARRNKLHLIRAKTEDRDYYGRPMA